MVPPAWPTPAFAAAPGSQPGHQAQMRGPAAESIRAAGRDLQRTASDRAQPKDEADLNNNRNNNRRRGRGNNRQQGGGGQQLNRIDSRARGNAPQLLEKYKKLAHDAHLNGDRVQAEYYLQFADHYFRVIADQRVRQEEQRRPRDERFEGGASYDEGDDNDFSTEGDIGFDPYRREEPREQQREPRREDGQGDGGQREGGREQRQNRNRDERPREDRPRRERFEQPQPVAAAPQVEPDAEPEPEVGGDFEPAGGNPFTRGNRAVRGLRPRRSEQDRQADEEQPLGLDPSLLPPAISETREQVLANEGQAESAEAPAPKRRGRPRKAAPETGGEPLETVNG